MKYFYKAIFYINLAIICAVWYSHSGYLFGKGIPEGFIAFGRLFGLILEYLILVQLVLIGRINFLERAFGHDKFNILHKKIGSFLVGFLIFHPTFLIFGYAGLSGISFAEQLRVFLTSWDDIFGGLTGLIFIAFAGALSAKRIRYKLKYEYWHFLHLFMYLGVWVAIEHQTITGDVSEGGPLVYWLSLNFAVFGLVLLYRFLRPIYLFTKHRFEVSSVVRESNDVTSIYISGKNIQDFKYKAGQFAILYFLKKGMWEGHPFSFSVAPNNEYIRFSIKAIGDFSSKIPELEKGTKVIVDGPLGVLTERTKEDKYLLIAGGIGIAPFLSLSESLAKQKKDVVLLYSNKTKNGTVFEKELQKLPIKSHFFLTDETNFDYFGFRKGRIDKEQITSLSPDYLEREIYVCGPPPMMDAIENILNELEVPRKKIHIEKFTF